MIDITEAVQLLFSSTTGGIATGAGVVFLAVYGLRQLAATMTRWVPPWSRVGRWLSSPAGGYILSAALTGSGALLKAATSGPMDRPAWGGVILTWITAMGLHQAVKRVPGPAHLEARRKLMAGSALLVLALALAAPLPAQASAPGATVLNPRQTLAGVPSVGDILDLVPGVGVTCRAGSCALAPHLWGSVALVDVAPGWTVGPVAGGAAILDGTGITGAVSLGAGIQAPWGSTVRLGLLGTADYYLPGPVLPAGWGVSGSLGFWF
jgi:hypothetical protein